MKASLFLVENCQVSYVDSIPFDICPGQYSLIFYLSSIHPSVCLSVGPFIYLSSILFYILYNCLKYLWCSGLHSLKKTALNAKPKEKGSNTSIIKLIISFEWDTVTDGLYNALIDLQRKARDWKRNPRFILAKKN